jgi:hypothetical protein
MDLNNEMELDFLTMFGRHHVLKQQELLFHWDACKSWLQKRFKHIFYVTPVDSQSRILNLIP